MQIIWKFSNLTFLRDFEVLDDCKKLTHRMLLIINLEEGNYEINDAWEYYFMTRIEITLKLLSNVHQKFHYELFWYDK